MSKMIKILRKLGATKSCGVRLADVDAELGKNSRELLWAAVERGEITYARQINGIGFWINENYEQNDNDNTPHEH